MARLTRADMEAALAFGAEVGTAASEPERADDWIVERVARATGSELAGYDLFDASCSPLFSTEIPGPVWEPTEHEWNLLRTQNPFSAHAVRNGRPTFSAIRLSDVVDMRSFRQSELYALHDDDIDYAIQARLPADDGGHWTLEVGRSGRDYAPRDLLFLDLIRPALVGYEAHRALAAKAAELQGMRARPGRQRRHERADRGAPLDLACHRQEAPRERVRQARGRQPHRCPCPDRPLAGRRLGRPAALTTRRASCQCPHRRMLPASWRA